MDHAITARLLLMLVVLLVLEQKDVALLQSQLDHLWLLTLGSLYRIANLIHYHQV